MARRRVFVGVGGPGLSAELVLKRVLIYVHKEARHRG